MKRNWKAYAPLLCRGLLGFFLDGGNGGLNHPNKSVARILILRYALVCVFGCYAFGSWAWGNQVVLVDRVVGLNSLGEASTLDRPDVLNNLVMQDLDLRAGLLVNRNDAGVAGLGDPAGHRAQLEPEISPSAVSFAPNPKSMSGVSSDERTCDACNNGGSYGIHDYVFWTFVGCFIGVAILCALSFLANVDVDAAADEKPSTKPQDV